MSASFHDACMKRIQPRLGRPLVKRFRGTYTSPDGLLAITCAVSREHPNRPGPSYWYAFHPHQKHTLANADEAYVAFGCGSERVVFLIPFHEFVPWLGGMNVTQTAERSYWHVTIYHYDNRFVLHRRKGYERIDLTKYLLPDEELHRSTV